MIKIYQPMTIYLKGIENKLSKLDIPILFKLPDASYPEPFIVLGSHNSIDFRTAKTGNLIEDTTLNIDIYMPISSRLVAEEVKSKAARLLGRTENIDSTMLIDDSIGREVYHIFIRVTDIII